MNGNERSVEVGLPELRSELGPAPNAGEVRAALAELVRAWWRLAVALAGAARGFSAPSAWEEPAGIENGARGVVREPLGSMEPGRPG